MSWRDWTGRALCLAITFGVAGAQTALYTPENSLLSAGIQTVLSALTNTCALLSAAFFVRGKASFDLQRLAFCALVVNFLNFAAFAAKSSPCVYVLNTLVTVISYAQLARILWPGNGDPIINSRRFGFLPFANFPSKGFYLEAKKQ